MRKLFFCVILFSISNVCYSADRWEKTYMGTIGRYSVGMYLARDGTKIQGEYFYIRHKKSIILRGEIQGDGVCVLHEFNEKGKPSAEFNGQLTELNGSFVFQGHWNKTNSTNYLSFSLTSTSLSYKAIQSEKLPDFYHLYVSSNVQIQALYPHMDFEYQGFYDEMERLSYWVLSNNAEGRNPIFESTGHGEVGTPISVSKTGNPWRIAFIGIKVNSPALITNLYATLKEERPCGSLKEKKRKTIVARVEKLFSRLPLFSESVAHACGCGTYIRDDGSSKLIFWNEDQDVQWYRLENPISLNIDDMGQAGLQIYFQPSGRTGKIRLRLMDVVLQMEKNEWWHAEIIHDDNEEFRAILIPVGIGECEFSYNRETASFNLGIFNLGETRLSIDDFSFSILSEALAKDKHWAQWSGIRLESFDRIPTAGFNSQSIRTLLTKVNLETKKTTAISLFQHDDFAANALYFPVLKFTEPDSDSVLDSLDKKGQLIKWWWRSFPALEKDTQNTRESIPLIGNDLLAFYSGVTGHVIPIAFIKRSMNDIGQHDNQYIPKDLNVFQSNLALHSFNYHKGLTNDASGFEWGILMPDALSDYLVNQMKTEARQEMKDFYGNRVVSYEKENVLVFLVDRQLYGSNGLRYQIPKEWKNDPMRMSIIKWMIFINPVK